MVQFEIAQQRRMFVEADLQHQLLRLYLMSGMVFDQRLDFVIERLPTFSPRNRVGNLVFHIKLGKMTKLDLPENGDGVLWKRFATKASTLLTRWTKTSWTVSKSNAALAGELSARECPSFYNCS